MAPPCRPDVLGVGFGVEELDEAAFEEAEAFEEVERVEEIMEAESEVTTPVALYKFIT
jgi:hypothetical protein